MKFALNAAFVFVFAGLLILPASAQTPVGTPPPLIIDSDEIIKVESRLIVIPVSVTDGMGNAVKGLDAENFVVFENRKKQDIVEVAKAEQVPLEIAILFDISASTDAMFRFEQETAAKFLLDVMRPIDHATIFTIGEQPRMLQQRSSAQISVQTIKTLQPSKEYTAFFDAVSSAADYLRKNSDPKSRKVVIAITDGEDTNSEGVREGFASAFAAIGERINTITNEQRRDILVKKRNEVRHAEQNKSLKYLQDADAVFYSINPAGSSLKLNSMSRFGQENMIRFADETGGTAFLPTFLPTNLKSDYENQANLRKNSDSLDAIFGKLRSELQAQYLVQYYSNGDFEEGKYVNVDLKVNVSLPQGISVRSRNGYFVKKL